MNRAGLVVMWVAFACVLWPREAAAYIDPGTGSILLQVILGGVAGIWLLVKLLRAKLVHLVHRWCRRPAAVKDVGE